MSPNAASAVRQAVQGAYFVSYYVRSLLGSKRPVLGGIKLTHDCNLACMHCPFRRRKGESLSFAQVCSSMDTLHDLGVRLIIFEGGEPFLWRDGEYGLADVVAQAKRRFFSVGVTTNGTFPIDVEADNVWVSIDGLKETHDRIRGRCFERVMANLASSRHNNLYVHVTINTLNWREVPDLVRHLADKVRGMTVQFHYPYEEADEELFLPFDKRVQVLDDLIELKRQAFPVADSYACLRALKDNSWRCQPWMIASVNPSGTVVHGCYVKGRGEIACERCGFSAHTELSLAYAGVLESILVGMRIFARA